jgi:tRNA (guanine37-N1)-methyltransferase
MAKTIDLIGDIAIVKFPQGTFWIYKKFFAWNFLRKNKSIITVLEKKGDIRGRLRKFETGFLAGKKKKETIHKENYCQFYLHVDETYFSPRLSNERAVVSEEISKIAKQNSKILVMFAGVAPFSIVLARFLKNNGIKAKIVSSELNRKASEYAKKNVALNKLQEYVEVVQGDSRKIETEDKFDIILMPRPNLKDSFIDSALKFSKKGTLIYYHGFGIKEKVLQEIDNKKLRIVYLRKAGDIAPRKWRWLAKLKVMG